MKKHMYLIDIGFLLGETDDEFESYAVCYDKKWGYYDTCQYLVDEEHLQKNIELEKRALPSCNGYIVVVDQGIWKLEENDLEENGIMTEFDCSSIDYSLESVVYSVTKNAQKEITENFIKK